MALGASGCAGPLMVLGPGHLPVCPVNNPGMWLMQKKKKNHLKITDIYDDRCVKKALMPSLHYNFIHEEHNDRMYYSGHRFHSVISFLPIYSIDIEFFNKT